MRKEVSYYVALRPEQIIACGDDAVEEDTPGLREAYKKLGFIIKVSGPEFLGFGVKAGDTSGEPIRVGRALWSLARARPELVDETIRSLLTVWTGTEACKSLCRVFPGVSAPPGDFTQPPERCGALVPQFWRLG
jgi:hypothetical protein